MIAIRGIGTHLPSKWYSNTELKQRFPKANIDPTWTQNRLGIHGRYLCNADETVVTLGSEALRKALADARLDSVDLIIVATSSSDDMSPSTACQIAGALQIKCPAFDINAVCSGFMYGMQLASHLLDRYPRIAVVATDTYSRLTDWTSRDAVFFGDGAGAFVLTTGKGHFHCNIGADNTGGDGFNCPRKGTFRMDGPRVFKFGTTTLVEQIQRVLSDVNRTKEQIDWIIPHQPSHGIIKHTVDKLQIEHERVVFNMGQHANTASASIPMAFSTALKDGRLKEGDNLILGAIGSGWTYGVAFLQFFRS